jgi:putative tricarboxylic transport membrane protein
VWLVFVFGVIGYFMKLYDLPMAPLVLGLVIGSLFEKALVQTSALGDGNVGILFIRPICGVVLLLAVLFVVGPTLRGQADPRPRWPPDRPSGRVRPRPPVRAGAQHP